MSADSDLPHPQDGMGASRGERLEEEEGEEEETGAAARQEPEALTKDERRAEGRPRASL